MSCPLTGPWFAGGSLGLRERERLVVDGMGEGEVQT
jgi:hypothetical protein